MSGRSASIIFIVAPALVRAALVVADKRVSRCESSQPTGSPLHLRCEFLEKRHFPIGLIFRIFDLKKFHRSGYDAGGYLREINRRLQRSVVLDGIDARP